MEKRRTKCAAGEFYNNEILNQRGITVNQAAYELGISPKSLNKFINNEMDDWSDWVIGLLFEKIAKSTDTSYDFWLNMHINHIASVKLNKKD